jgi:hypothetical protein
VIANVSSLSRHIWIYILYPFFNLKISVIRVYLWISYTSVYRRIHLGARAALDIHG